MHGTTAADNAMIQMKGAPTGLLVTEGFRDEIEMRRCYKEDIWDPSYPAPDPIARRRVRLEIDERLTSEGTVDRALDEEGVRKATARLRAFGVTSIAVCFLHSYLNPSHELRAREIILDEYPDVELISLSHEVWPKPPEFERTSTTLVNAFVGPPIVRYLDRLERACATPASKRSSSSPPARAGWPPPGRPRHAHSPPSARARRAGSSRRRVPRRRPGLGDVVSVDMGGTSYDVCLIRDGRPEVKTDWNWRHRYCIALPMVDVHSIGAGGGSLSRNRGRHAHRRARIGRQRPGPGVLPAGRHRAHRDRRRPGSGPPRSRPPSGADASTSTSTGRARRWPPWASPWGSTQRRPRSPPRPSSTPTCATPSAASCPSPASMPAELDLVAFGGMGAVHAARHAALLGMRRVLIPRAAPAFSALGLLTANHVIDEARTLQGDWRAIDLGRLSELAEELMTSAEDALEVAGIPRRAPGLRMADQPGVPGTDLRRRHPHRQGRRQPHQPGVAGGRRQRVPPPQRGGPAD